MLADSLGRRSSPLPLLQIVGPRIKSVKPLLSLWNPALQQGIFVRGAKIGVTSSWDSYQVPADPWSQACLKSFEYWGESESTPPDFLRFVHRALARIPSLEKIKLAG
ncbi:hypothetical protein SEMRO_186_G080710.1 [Seminavis robusta]|uniref:Uncharacterized protein n=1 Tax=Seminavis robusta TaxID=568900 RepID=A0A9N8DJG9_9STRA|nr:hypothetical protein SEMRO_186_G080710.1 [Seminavis robusta]|eukprot:Sro186_g080710.1 n/a (107) ;mRNA; f:61551-61871